MSKRGLHIDLIEHFQHKGIGRRDLVERHGQIGPHDQRDLIGGVVAHERLITGRLAAVIVDGVRSPAVALYLNRRLCSQGVHDLNTVNYETGKNLGAC